MSRWLGLLLSVWAGTGIHAAEPPTVEPAVVLDLELRGVGELRFGERFEWQLVIEPPAEVRAGEGIRLGAVVTVMTVFDRCVAAICRSAADPGARRVEPLTYIFE